MPIELPSNSAPTRRQSPTSRWHDEGADRGHAPGIVEYLNIVKFVNHVTCAVFCLLLAVSLAQGGFQVPLAPPDRTGSIDELTKRAEEGDAVSQAFLGFKYFLGSGVPKNPAEASKWFRLAAEQGNVGAQFQLGEMYARGEGVAKDDFQAIKWYRLAADLGDAIAQRQLGVMYARGRGVDPDDVEAARWFRRAAEQGNADAQTRLGMMHDMGLGVARDDSEAVKWYRRAADQGDVDAQYQLAAKHFLGEGTPQDFVQAYAWASIAAANGDAKARELRDDASDVMTREQIAEAQALSKSFKPRVSVPGSTVPVPDHRATTYATGTGFFVASDGYLITADHVIAQGTQFRVRTQRGEFSARVVRRDPANDLAVLKVEGTFATLHVLGSGRLRPADRVSTTGFPNPRLQGFAPKFSGGEVAALSGPGDDPRFIQISVPIQPGNSGGPLVNSAGAVVGVVTGKLDSIKTLNVTGQIPENVNYAIKGTILLGLLESVPGLADTLEKASTSDLT